MSIDPAVTEELRDVLATVAAVPVTPFGPDGAPDWDCHGRLIDRLIDNGITLVTPNGNTGEFYTLSAEETRAATESAIRAARGRAEVLAGVGHDLPTAIGSASHARAAGARMIMIHQPVSPYLSAEGWVDYHAAIAGSVPDLGVVLYIRDPRIAGRHIRELGRRSPNVVGVKYGVKDMVQFAGVARDAGLGRFTWLAGLAELTAPACWTSGASGFTSGLVNVAPGLALSMLESLRGGDMAGAMKAWDACRPFEELRAADSSADNVSVVKEALAQLGLCRPDVRPPSHRVPEQVRAQIAQILAGWGLSAGEEGR
jgi:4-hydroxy-tetrahydrodipicolinate synthase